MKTPALLLSASLFLAATGTTIAQPANDHFANAIVMNNYLVTGSNVNATKQANDPGSVALQNGGRSPTGGRSVWWRWTAPDSRRYTVKTGDRSGKEPSSNFDTQLGVYTGATLGTLVEVGSNEDNVLYPSGLSSVEIDAVQGQTYHIMVDGYGGQTGTIYLYVIPTRYTLSVSANPPGSGSVSFDPVFESEGYLAGTVVTLTATPNSSTNFYGWSGDAGGRSNVINVVMNSSKHVVANFFNEPQVVLNDPQLLWQNRSGPVAAWFFTGT
ncbi:MAG: InlB B-repeat-containing protein, partial [Limisphaerales bacterium]